MKALPQTLLEWAEEDNKSLDHDRQTLGSPCRHGV